MAHKAVAANRQPGLTNCLTGTEALVVGGGVDVAADGCGVGEFNASVAMPVNDRVDPFVIRQGEHVLGQRPGEQDRVAATAAVCGDQNLRRLRVVGR